MGDFRRLRVPLGLGKRGLRHLQRPNQRREVWLSGTGSGKAGFDIRQLGCEPFAARCS